MANPAEAKYLSRADRMMQLLDHLGIERAHFAADLTPDWEDLVSKYAHRIASLTLVFPQPAALPRLAGLSSRLLVIHGDQPPDGGPIAQALTLLPGSREVTLAGSSNLSWDNTLPHYVETVAPPLLAFLDSHGTGVAPLGREITESATGDIAGIAYELRGSGQPLFMLPLGMAPTQWDSLLPALYPHYTTLVLTGPELGFMPLLEARGRSRGYRQLMRNLFYELRPQPGETILDVGCGSGVMEIWLAEHTGGHNPITALDINPYFLREASAQIRKAGFESLVELREGNAVSLPFDDNQFDIVFSTTVMEEVDANQMLSELIRVTQPGGRVGVVVRSVDEPHYWSAPIRPELRLKGDSLRGDVGRLGCASADLYRMFKRAGLREPRVLPDATVFSDPYGPVEAGLKRGVQLLLTQAEADEWNAAIDRAAHDGSFYVTWPHHCAVGTKAV